MKISRRMVGAGLVLGIAIAPIMSATASTRPPKVMAAQASNDVNVPSGEGYPVRNPRNPLQVAMAWPATTDLGKGLNTPAHAYCGVGTSTDGGRTWTVRHMLMNTSNYGVPVPSVSAGGYTPFPVAPCGDGMLGVGPSGVLTMIGAEVGSPSTVQAVTSTDWGRTWSAPVEIFGVRQAASGAVAQPNAQAPSLGPGRPWMTVDAVTGQVVASEASDPGNAASANGVSAEGRFIAVSDDGGRTWGPPRRVSPEGQSSSPPTMANGILAATYTQTPNDRTTSLTPVPCQQTCTVFETSTDKGVTWVRHAMPPQAVMPTGSFEGAIPAADPSQRRRFAVLTSSGGSGGWPVVSATKLHVWVTKDSGATWKLTRTIDARSGVVLNKAWISYSPTGALGVYWREQHSNGTNDVAAMVARDGARGFSDPVYLVKGATENPTASAANECACSLYLDKTSLLASWVDARSSTGQREIFFGRFDYTTLKPAKR